MDEACKMLTAGSTRRAKEAAAADKAAEKTISPR
jgi:hypothetical protein